jgi:hypothetical protein
MTIIDHYLQSVGLLLSKVDRQDVLAELAEHLRSKMEERESELGRALTEQEQQAVVAAYGDPLTVASRYGKVGPGFAFGPIRLISAAAFPAYVGVLALIVAINIISIVVDAVSGSTPLWPQLAHQLLTLLVVFAVVTVVFAGIDVFIRRSQRRQPGGAEAWLFWTPYLKYVPRWYSASGLIFLAVVAVAWGWWWGTWPQAPMVFFGAPGAQLELAPEWLRFDRGFLALLLVGIALRAASLIRPDLNWPLPVMRLVVNVIALAMVLLLLRSGPFVLVDVGAAGTAAADLAAGIDRAMHGAARGFGIYWFFNALWLAFVCAGYVRYYANRRRQRNADRG